MNELSKIKLIEAPLDDNLEIFRQELEEALGGWNCGSFDNITCNEYISGNCSAGTGTDYCKTHSCHTKVF